MTPGDFLALCLNVGFGLIMLSLVLAFVRLAKGPSFSDRVVALDMMSVSIVAFCALYAIKTGVSSFVDIAIVVALIGFLATVALARFAERGIHRNRHLSDISPADVVATQTKGAQRADQGDKS
ncbi:monovalent cation/H+ antiporter complex subunit F [Meridianimarinicoccus aquatilis]|uniref:pH regulation protein F n=1 Tax=Meridianimarinicoccus aquatilis TaxID=2552766 RepID=A0A4R6B4Z8_9RHOB|nr:cation:proton antiporter [Fluviibacterium aquatile]TDL90556.1 pH regulation protein F [Fluviibacterium aquatile]